MVTAALISTSALMTVGAGEFVRNYCRRALRTPMIAPVRSSRS